MNTSKASGDLNISENTARNYNTADGTTLPDADRKWPVEKSSLRHQPFPPLFSKAVLFRGPSLLLMRQQASRCVPHWVKVCHYRWREMT